MQGGSGLATAGLITGVIGLAISVLAVIYWVFVGAAIGHGLRYNYGNP
jgi:hypothetical protein